MVDDMIAGQLDEFSGVIAAFTAELPSFFMCLVVHLCISVSHCCRCVSARASMTDRTDAHRPPAQDVNKQLVLRSPELTKLLTEALLLDPEHVRRDQSEDVKCAIQRDAAECIMQLALYELGRETLQNVPEVLDALRMLVDREALTEEARRNAEGALMALDPQEVAHAVTVDQLHVMMSCAFLSASIKVPHGAAGTLTKRACEQTSGRSKKLSSALWPSCSGAGTSVRQTKCSLKTPMLLV
jgi:hypothetical protein